MKKQTTMQQPRYAVQAIKCAMAMFTLVFLLGANKCDSPVDIPPGTTPYRGYAQVPMVEGLQYTYYLEGHAAQTGYTAAYGNFPKEWECQN